MTDSQQASDRQHAAVGRDAAAEVDVNPDAAFYAFVVAAAPILIGIARLVTGDHTAAGLVADEAWPEVYRRWPRLAGKTARLASALAPFVAASARSAARARPKAGGGLELREYGLVDAGTVLGHERPGASIGEALLDLSPRARAALSLRWYAGLSDSELTQAMRLRPLRPGRVADDAFAEVRHTAAPAAGGGMPAQETEPAAVREFTSRLRAELYARAGPAIDGTAELARIRPALTAVRQQRPRRQRPARALLTSGGVVAAAVSAAVIAAIVATSGGGGEAVGRQLKPPVAADGGQLVGYQTVYTTVPVSWSHNAVRCGKVVESTVLYPDVIAGCDHRPLPAAAVPPSSVTFGAPPTSPIPLGRLRKVNEVGGNAVFATVPIRRAGLIQQLVVIPRANVQMVVRTPDPRVLDNIVDSLRAVPQGYVVVPACTRLPLRDAIGRLVASGLDVKLTQASTLNMHYGAPPVTHQSIATGQIVARGTVVGLGFPSTN